MKTQTGKLEFTGTDTQKAELKKDFLEFSGGHHPGEASDEVETYLEHYVTDESHEAVETFFESWGEEETAKEDAAEKARGKNWN